VGRVSELSEQRAAAVEQAALEGVRVLGDPGELKVVDADHAPETVAAPDAIAIDAAVHGLTGLIDGVVAQRRTQAVRATRRRRRLERQVRSSRPAPAPLEDVPGRDVARELGRRVLRRVRGGRA